MTETPYTPHFFEYHEEGSRRSARATVPLVLELVGPKSVVDVGCGIGTWLAELYAAGVADYLGIDGDYINREALVIDPERFMPRELDEPLAIDRRFDLAISLEVAEHLPDEMASSFIGSLTAPAPVVLFSAAIPHQGGDGHVNEQWPEYWQIKFAERNYVVVDCLRERLWRHKDVKPWYAQNLLFFVDRDRLNDYPQLAAHFRLAGEHPRLSMVHPEHYLLLHEHTVRQLAEAQRAAVRASVSLREINLVAFPDWQLPQPVLLGQLRAMLGAVLTHPQGAQMALLIHFAGEVAGSFLAHVAREFLAPGGVPVASAPAISGVGQNFGAEQWKMLIPLLNGRVVLANEDTRTVTALGTQGLRSVPLAFLESKQPLAAQ